MQSVQGAGCRVQCAVACSVQRSAVVKQREARDGARLRGRQPRARLLSAGRRRRDACGMCLPAIRPARLHYWGPDDDTATGGSGAPARICARRRGDDNDGATITQPGSVHLSHNSTAARPSQRIYGVAANGQGGNCRDEERSRAHTPTRPRRKRTQGAG